MDKSVHKSLLCYGEISWDRVWILNKLPQNEGDCHLLFEQEGAGGCALNSACVLRGFGHPVTLAGNAVGADPRGERIGQYLRGIGVDYREETRADLKTPFCQALVDQKSGKRDFILSHQGIQEFKSPQAGDAFSAVVDETRSGRFTHRFVQPYLREASLEFLKATQAAPGWTLIQDVDADAPAVPFSDAVQISLPDSEAFTADAISRLAKGYFRGKMRTLLVTAGGRGVAVCERDAVSPQLFEPILAEKVVDTTGCGDAFRAGLMSGLFLGLSFEDSIRRGQQAGSKKAGILGSHFV